MFAPAAALAAILVGNARAELRAVAAAASFAGASGAAGGMPRLVEAERGRAGGLLEGLARLGRTQIAVRGQAAAQRGQAAAQRGQAAAQRGQVAAQRGLVAAQRGQAAAQLGGPLSADRWPRSADRRPRSWVGLAASRSHPSESLWPRRAYAAAAAVRRVYGATRSDKASFVR
jgi:hypothetical protein